MCKEKEVWIGLLIYVHFYWSMQCEHLQTFLLFKYSFSTWTCWNMNIALHNTQTSPFFFIKADTLHFHSIIFSAGFHLSLWQMTQWDPIEVRTAWILCSIAYLVFLLLLKSILFSAKDYRARNLNITISIWIVTLIKKCIIDKNVKGIKMYIILFVLLSKIFIYALKT